MLSEMSVRRAAHLGRDSGDAAPEPRHAARRAHRRPRTRARVRKSRLPARRAREDPPALHGQALDRLPARVPRLAARAAPPARPLHRALLPRRGDRVRRRAPAVRALPPRGLRPLLRVWRDLHPARSARTRSTPGSTPSAWIPRTRGAAPPRGPARRAPGRRVRPARRRALARPSAPRSAAGRPPGYGPATAPGGGHVVLLTPPSLVSVLRAGWDPVVPLLHPSALSHG